MILRSDKFNDVYFSVEDGMDETHHVFLAGNHLPQAWLDKKDNPFIIAETGFGTGLNFLCAWKMFEETAAPHQQLHFISIEKYPLSKDQIAEALSVWRPDLGHYIDRLLELYPIRVAGPHLIAITPRVSLTIWIGDIADILPHWQGFEVDAWFLDGFTPAKNPEMWTQDLYSHMARLAHGDTRFATFTAAGQVRRGLVEAGFEVKKSKGFGRKRDMSLGVFCGETSRHSSQKNKVNTQKLPKTMAIIGGGLAGCAMAYFAHQRGIKAVIYEAGDHLASGASGGQKGMINPRLTAKPSVETRYYVAAYAHALRVLPLIADVDFKIHGSLQVCLDEEKDKRFGGYINHLGWHGDHIERRGDDLYYPEGASLSPYKLCHAMAKNADVRLNHAVGAVDDIDADMIVLANGFHIKDLLQCDWPIYSVRGQVSWIRPKRHIDKNICFGGYITPLTPNGLHMLGASFQPWSDSTALRDADHVENINLYNASIEKYDGYYDPITKDDVAGGWAALRTVTHDRFPIIGALDDRIYVSTAHGSHGIVSSLMAAQIILAMKLGEPIPAYPDVLRGLSPKRFHKRQRFSKPSVRT